MIDRLYKIAQALNARFPDGNAPFVIVTRLAEECGEVAAHNPIIRFREAPRQSEGEA